MRNEITRRAFGATLAAGAAAGAESYWAVTPERIRRHDDGVDDLLKRQTVEAGSLWRGGLADVTGLHHGGTAAGLVNSLVVGLVQAGSRHYRSGEVMERLRLALGFLERKTTRDGNLDLLITNFNSPPDTAFAMYSLAGAAHLARQARERELEGMLEGLVKRHAGGVARGGVHTPNHRWVMCAALAQAHALYPDAAYVRRIDQWLREGIDIDEDGQYSERSTAVYNAVVNRALAVTAMKLGRWELLDPVRRNLESMAYLLHPGQEVVTDISRRQDQYERGTLANYWLAARLLAVRDRNGRYEAMARQGSPGLGELMEYPELGVAGPEPEPLPENYEKQFPALGIARIRRGRMSATLMLGGGSSRFFGVRQGEAVINTVRLAAAFFGKGQFRASSGEKRGTAYEFAQELEGPYYQPIGRVVRVGTDAWAESRRERRQTEVCRMSYRVSVEEVEQGFRLRMRAEGTADVPVAVEINLRAGGRLSGCEELEGLADGWLLSRGYAELAAGGDRIRFGPGRGEHRYTQVRGAEAKLAGPSVYLTAYTPFEHTLEFRCG